jgi:hypothetical protein
MALTASVGKYFLKNMQESAMNVEPGDIVLAMVFPAPSCSGDL